MDSDDSRFWRWENAIYEFEEAIKFEPERVELRLCLGLAYRQLWYLEDDEEPSVEYNYEELFNRACEVQDDEETTLEDNQEAQDTLRLGFGVAQEHCDLAPPIDKLWPWHDELVGAKEAIGIRADDAEAHVRLGVSYVHLGRMEDALGEFKEAIRIRQDYAEAYVHIGWTYRCLGRWLDASRRDRVHLTLTCIGKPAHYSRVAEIYNDVFPDFPMSEHDVHITLGRMEDRGVVWIGIKGTFALKEWGYEKPTKGLFETVAEIVRKRYAVTRRPVPFSFMSSEITKYRRVVNPNSVLIAAHCNPALKPVGEDAFVPREADQKEDEQDLQAEELDRILRRFEKQP
jgi:hypothetical protein